MSAFTWPPDLPAPARSSTAAEPVAAAVLVPLYRDEDLTTHVVLTRRRADLRRHAGEISFPGGRRDETDATLEQTALREAQEEVGLPPGDVSLIGELPATSTFATNYVIHPFVGEIRPGFAWKPSPREVDEVLELPLADVSAARTITTLERRGITFQTDAYVVDDALIWGATARILEHLIARLADRPGEKLALPSES